MHIVEPSPTKDWVALAPSSLSANELTMWATRANCGAVVTFCGAVRDTSHEHDDIVALEYETGEEMAMGRLREVVAEARTRWPMLGAVAIHHRTGRVELSDTAVVVAVSSPHRREAFEAAQYCIDAVKDCVPMWKRELWEGGSAWSQDGRDILSVAEVPTAATVTSANGADDT
jgi:molybdopterin synthase catalytic subunit